MSGIQVEVLGHRVLIKPDDIEEVSSGGIVVVATEEAARMEKVHMQYGTIVAIGPQAWKAFKKFDPRINHAGNWVAGDRWAEVGDYIIYSKYGGKFVVDPVTKEEYVIVNDSDVLCRVNREEL